MYLLERLSIHHWYLIYARDFELRGDTGIVGPTGSGKSSLLDAIQTVISGNNMKALELNASAEGKSDRKVRDYCLGYVEDLGREPVRPRCETTLVLTFRDQDSGRAIAVGLLLYADEAESRERVVSRFIVKDFSFWIRDFMTTGADGGEYVLTHAEMLERLKAHKGFQAYNVTSQAFVEAYLQAMRGRNAVPNPRQFLNNFSNMVAFRPVKDTTEFVRTYVLPPDRLNVERIRDSIDHWRGIDAEVQRLEAMLSSIQSVRNRFRTWGRQKVALNTRGFIQAHAERLRLEIEREAEAERLARVREALEGFEATRSSHNNAIAQLREEIRGKEALIARSDIGAKIEAIEARKREAEREDRTARSLLAKRIEIAGELAGFDRLRDCIPISLHRSIGDAAQLAEAATAEGADGLVRREAEIDRLEASARALAGARDSLGRQDEALAVEIGEVSRKIEEIEGQLRDAGDEGAVLSGPVRRFRELLARAGIEAKALPDLVEVTAPRWAYALESLLGANREALLVEPQHQEAAHEILFRHRREPGMHRCRLIQTRRMDRVDPRAEPGSIATIVVTDHPHVRKFINYHVGRFRMVETEAELDRHDHAIMANGKSSGGLSLRVFGDLTPILGRTARAGALEASRAALKQFRDEHAALVRRKALLKSALESLFKLAHDETPPIAECLRRISDAKAKLSSAEADRRNVEDEETAGLRSEIEGLLKDIAAYEEELRDEVLPEIERLGREERDLDVKVRGFEDRIRERLAAEEEASEREAEMRDLIGFLDDPETVEQARERIGVELFHRKGSERALLAEIRNKAAEDADTLRRTMVENERRASREFADFIQRYVGENPLSASADHVAMLAWLIKREHDLETNQLRQYRDLVATARREMESALKEDLLAKLNDKFEALKSQIRILNQRLDRHRFTGMRYWFSYAVDPRMSKLQALAERIAGNPQRGLAAIEAEGGGADFDAAMAQIEEILDRTQDTSPLEDYRNYYSFELHMETSTGVTTDLGRRSKTGSGGQKQAPYYVAIAAAMASVYYPGSRGRAAEGMGLVMFDEAFNRLDAPNTKAILEFYRDLSLQVIVAAPPDKRLTFLETMNTLISVNRIETTDQLYIDEEHIGERARAVMREENPEHRGIEGYRKEIAEEQAKQAAE